MKIYKLDIDTSKPIRQVVQMQQNSEGVLSVNVSNDGKYIRNLSCAMYEDGNEISAIADGDNSFGYKLNVGDTSHTVKVTAKSAPYECSASYVVDIGTGSAKSIQLDRAQLEPGVYNQDEFASLLRFGSGYGYQTFILPSAGTKDYVNIDRIVIIKHNPTQQLFFIDKNGTVMPTDAQISVLSACDLIQSATVKRTGSVLSSYTYPAIGYWTDYSLDTIIKPSTNAACYAERDIQEPTPDPDPTPDPEEPVEPTED